MDSKARAARERVAHLERELQAARWSVDSIERDCKHQWSDPEYTPDVQEAYTIPRVEGFGSHPPRPAHHVPREETPKWARTCDRCGMVETTTHMTEKVTKTQSPRF